MGYINGAKHKKIFVIQKLSIFLAKKILKRPQSPDMAGPECFV